MKFTFNPFNLINILKNKSINKSDVAKTNSVLVSEMDNCFEDTKSIINELTVEKAIKYVLWNGLCNNYGLHGINRNKSREFKINKKGNTIKKYYYKQRYGRGKLLSIDFGTSNIGRELAYTHSGIVLADYTDYVVVVPITSKKDFNLSQLAPDIQKVILLIEKSEYPKIDSDSYVLMHQIKSVSKNRITKIITSFSKTKMMEQIEQKLFEVHCPYMNMKYKKTINNLDAEIKRLRKIIKKQYRE